MQPSSFTTTSLAATTAPKALEFYKKFNRPEAPILWAGRPTYKWTAYVQIIIFLAVSAGTFSACVVAFDKIFRPHGFFAMLAFALAPIAFLSVIIFFGTLALWRKNSSAYYAFSKERLWVYSKFTNKVVHYPLAALPDFVAFEHWDETITLRAGFRYSVSEQGVPYKTPILHYLSNGQVVLDHLRKAQQAAKQVAAQEKANPSWLPRD